AGVVELRVTFGDRGFTRIAAPDRQPRHVSVLGQPGKESEPVPAGSGPVAARFRQHGFGLGGKRQGQDNGKAVPWSHGFLLLFRGKLAVLCNGSKGRKTGRYPASR